MARLCQEVLCVSSDHGLIYWGTCGDKQSHTNKKQMVLTQSLYMTWMTCDVSVLLLDILVTGCSNLSGKYMWLSLSLLAPFWVIDCRIPKWKLPPCLHTYWIKIYFCMNYDVSKSCFFSTSEAQSHSCKHLNVKLRMVRGMHIYYCFGKIKCQK